MTTQQNFEQRYLQRLNLLAKACSFNLDAQTVSSFDEFLADLGYERLTDAIGKILTTRKATDRFPSIRDIRQAAGEVYDEPQDDKAKATEIAHRIWTAIGRFGGYNGEDAKAWLGPIAWATVRLAGGWSSICEIENENQQTTYVAQWRDPKR